MKVYFIGGRYDGCYYVRCLLPLIYNGWDGQKTSMWGQRVSNEQMFKGAMASDIIVFQRPDDPKKVEAIDLLKQAGKKVVFDNDDTYKPDSGVPTQVYFNRDKKTLDNIHYNLSVAIKKSNLVTTTTEFLAKEYRKINPNVVVLPNLIDPEDWEEPLPNLTHKTRIGMIGSVLSNNDFKPALSALQRLSKRSDVQIVILGLPKDAKKGSVLEKVFKPELTLWKGFKNIEWQSWIPQPEYNQALNELRLDIMLIPRDDSYFNRCKSNIKFLEASMCEIAVVAQGFPDKLSPYEVNKEDFKYLKLVSDNSKWYETINNLIINKNERIKMAKQAREYVHREYNIHTKYNLWQKAYDKIE